MGVTAQGMTLGSGVGSVGPTPNLVLILVDCLRPDRLGCYGSQASAAPHIDRLAMGGVVFEQAIAMGFHTLTTMPSILSGCYPSTFGGFAHLADARPRLPQVLRSLGYRTAAFSPNPYLSRARGYALGFDDFDECLPGLMPRSNHWKALLVRGINRLFRRWGVSIECPPYLDAQSVTAQAMRWLRRAAEPYFLWIHYMDAHTPYNLQRCSLLLPQGRGQRPYDSGFWKRLWRQPDQVSQAELVLAQRLYDDGVRFVDSQIGRLVEMLRTIGQLDRTVFVITADHGEAFCEHGSFGHSNHLYENIIHVPLVISPAEAALAGHRVSAQVRQLDLAPTLIEVAGGNPPSAMQGVSLLPNLQGRALSQPLPAMSQTNPAKNWLVSLREPPWKLIWRVDAGTTQGDGVELYHLEDDPSEQNNLADRYPQRTAIMQEALRQHIATLDFSDGDDSEPEDIDPAVLDRLQALGYVDGV
jgi:arylsulfatase A-like enzyme